MNVTHLYGVLFLLKSILIGLDNDIINIIRVKQKIKSAL